MTHRANPSHHKDQYNQGDDLPIHRGSLLLFQRISFKVKVEIEMALGGASASFLWQVAHTSPAKSITRMAPTTCQ